MNSGFLVRREFVAMLEALPDADMDRILGASLRAWLGRTVEVGVLERAIVAGISSGAADFAANRPTAMTDAERAKLYRARKRHECHEANVTKVTDVTPSRVTTKEGKKEGQSSARTRGGTTTKVPSLDVVLQAAEQYNWRQYAPGWTAEQVRDAVREAYSDLVAQGWTDVQGHAVSNWRAYLSKAVSEKKISAARAAVVSCPMGSTEEE